MEVKAVRKRLKGTRIVIVEDLTKTSAELFSLARGLDGVSQAWTRDGRVFAKGTNGQIVELHHGDDINAAITKLKASTSTSTSRQPAASQRSRTSALRLDRQPPAQSSQEKPSLTQTTTAQLSSPGPASKLVRQQHTSRPRPQSDQRCNPTASLQQDTRPSSTPGPGSRSPRPSESTFLVDLSHFQATHSISKSSTPAPSGQDEKEQ